MTEEIKKLIELRINAGVIDNRSNYALFNEGMRKGSEIAKEIILSKWQEAERWRKVEEELPDVKEFGVSDYVLTKCDYESYQVAQYCKNKYYPDGSWFNPDRELSITPVEWKPIS